MSKLEYVNPWLSIICYSQLLQHLVESISKYDKRLHNYKMHLQKQKEEAELHRKAEEKRLQEEYAARLNEWKKQKALAQEVRFLLVLNFALAIYLVLSGRVRRKR